MDKKNIHPKHKERLLDRIEDLQSSLDGSFLVGLEEIQRELHNNYSSNHGNLSILERIVKSVRDFFQEL